MNNCVDECGDFHKILDYKNCLNRNKTFDMCNNEICLSKRGILSEAGFVYIGDGMNDAVACFTCWQRLRTWELDDDPWVEHALWSPTCGYVRLVKGSL